MRKKSVEAETSRHKQNRPQTKKDQLALALLVVRTDPILTAPGGWGLRNPEPKGPGQRTQVFSQCRAAVAWRKSGDTMIPANDPVTVCRDRVPPLRVGGLLRSNVLTGPPCSGEQLARSCNCHDPRFRGRSS